MPYSSRFPNDDPIEYKMFLNAFDMKYFKEDRILMKQSLREILISNISDEIIARFDLKALVRTFLDQKDTEILARAALKKLERRGKSVEESDEESEDEEDREMKDDVSKDHRTSGQTSQVLNQSQNQPKDQFHHDKRAKDQQKTDMESYGLSEKPSEGGDEKENRRKSIKKENKEHASRSKRAEEQNEEERMKNVMKILADFNGCSVEEFMEKQRKNREEEEQRTSLQEVKVPKECKNRKRSRGSSRESLDESKKMVKSNGVVEEKMTPKTVSPVISRSGGQRSVNGLPVGPQETLRFPAYRIIKKSSPPTGSSNTFGSQRPSRSPVSTGAFRISSIPS